MEEFKKSALVDSYFEKSYGWAVFPKVGKFAFIVGMGGAGGEVYVKKDGGEPEKVGVTTLMFASGGWSLGLTIYKEIIFFEDKEAFEKFAKGNFEFQAGAKCHVLTVGGDAAARSTGGSDLKDKDEYYEGMMTFVLPTVGAMIDVSAEGQKFSYSPMTE